MPTTPNHWPPIEIRGGRAGSGVSGQKHRYRDSPDPRRRPRTAHRDRRMMGTPVKRDWAAYIAERVIVSRSHDVSTIDYGHAIVNSCGMGSDGQRAPRVYRSSRREAQARLTRRRVLDAATTVFLEHGFAGSTMRAIASQAGVSVPTVELLFGTKGRLLQAAIDVAIAGDDEPVPVLDRRWTETAVNAATADDFLDIVASIITSAQQRSAGLVLALFEAASTDTELTDLAEHMTTQRATTAGWIVDQLTRKAPLGVDRTRQEAIDTMWILMDPAVFDRLTRQRQWAVQQYQRWLATSVARLLIGDTATVPSTATAGRCST